MSAARNLSKMINKENYITHSGHSSVSGLNMPTETSMVGMITSFSMTTASDWRATNRWLICDGSAISRTTYSDLFLVVGTTWGVGDGSSTFNLPDLRGEFLRGRDSGKGSDADAASRTGGEAVGSSQNHGNPRLFGSFSEYHANARHFISNQTGHSGTQAIYGSGNSNYRQALQSDDGPSAHVNLDSSLVISHGSDVRPRNVAVQYCIKY